MAARNRSKPSLDFRSHRRGGGQAPPVYWVGRRWGWYLVLLLASFASNGWEMRLLPQVVFEGTAADALPLPAAPGVQPDAP